MPKVILAPNGALYDLPFSIWEEWGKRIGKPVYGYYYEFPDINEDGDFYDETCNYPMIYKDSLENIEKIVRKDLSAGTAFLTTEDYGESTASLSVMDIYEKNFFRRLDDTNSPIRTNKELISLLESTYKDCRIRIIDVPDDVEWYIESDDEGLQEWVAERHRTWE